MPSGKPGTRKPKPPDHREAPARGKPRDGSKNPGGRPEEWTPERIEEFADTLMAWARGDDAQFLESFCKEHHTYPQKLSELSEKSPKFSESLKVAKAACAANIAQATFDGLCPPPFGIFALKQHKWTDKHVVENTGTIEQKHTGTVTMEVDTSKIADLLNGAGSK